MNHLQPDLVFALPGSVAVEIEKTPASEAVGGIRIPSLSTTVPLWQDSEEDQNSE
jgi:hypothetical protein